jgi:hypothetical protein
VGRVAELGSFGGIERMKNIRTSLPSVSASVSALRRFADTFVGLTIKASRRRLSRGKIKMTTWDVGKQLVVTFPKHEMRLMFIRREVGVASVQVLSK